MSGGFDSERVVTLSGRTGNGGYFSPCLERLRASDKHKE
jgi:hypothetical protein